MPDSFQVALTLVQCSSLAPVFSLTEAAKFTWRKPYMPHAHEHAPGHLPGIALPLHAMEGLSRARVLAMLVV